MIDLKPCPFCGGTPFVYYSGSQSNRSFSEVICKECKCQTPRLRDNEAIEAWNRRVGEDDRQGMESKNDV